MVNITLQLDPTDPTFADTLARLADTFTDRKQPVEEPTPAREQAWYEAMQGGFRPVDSSSVYSVAWEPTATGGAVPETVGNLYVTFKSNTRHAYIYDKVPFAVYLALDAQDRERGSVGKLLRALVLGKYECLNRLSQD